MTVDWDEELRKLNASQYGKRQERDLTKDINDPEAVKWARKNAKIAQSAVEKSTDQVRRKRVCDPFDSVPETYIERTGRTSGTRTLREFEARDKRLSYARECERGARGRFLPGRPRVVFYTYVYLAWNVGSLCWATYILKENWQIQLTTYSLTHSVCQLLRPRRLSPRDLPRAASST